MCDNLDEIMPYLDGVTLTLHTKHDLLSFKEFDETAKNLKGKSLRLNVFEEVGNVTTINEWSIKNNIQWIENCPLPQDEIFMRYNKE
jgi:hypothetical protein